MSATAVVIAGRTVRLDISERAQRALTQQGGPTTIALELYFSCLIRKRVRVEAGAATGPLCARISDALSLCFQPVMSRACAIEKDAAGAAHPELIPFPIQRAQAFVPRWLKLDYRRHAFHGEYGY